jgi:opacity protein-like surface antigen
MKRLSVIVLFLVAVLILSVPTASFAEHKKGEGYITLKGGAYFPTSEDLDNADFETGFNGEVVLGMYYNKNLALEFGGGYFRTESSVAEASGFHEKAEIRVVPIIVNIKAVLPIDYVELYGGGGFGLYVVDFESNTFDPVAGSFSGDDNDTILGGHVMAGANIDITKKIFIGVEGKYIVTADAKLLGSRINLDGFTVTGTLGFRF